jgi:hypothetical protein
MVKITRAKPGLARMAWLGILTSVCFMAALVLNFFPSQTAGAGSFTSPTPIGGGAQLFKDMNVKVRPTDGLAFISGAKIKVLISNSSNTGTMYDINDSGSPNATQWPSLAFANDGTGFVAWRWVGNSYKGYMRIIPAGWNGGSLPSGFDLGSRVSQASGVDMDQPGIEFSRKANKLYVAGYFKTPNGASLGIVESSDKGNTFSNFKVLAKDSSNSNMAPEICVDANDNIHVLSRLAGNLISTSRINGAWDANPTILINGNTGYDARGADGRSMKSIVCAPDGTVYAVWKYNSGIGVSSRLPGQAWKTVTTNLMPNTETKSVKASISPDGTLWVVAGNNSGTSGYVGTWVVTSTDKGATFSSPAPVSPKHTYSNEAVAIDASGVGSKIHVATSFNLNLPEQTFYSYADYTGAGSLPPSQPPPPPAPGDPGTDPSNPSPAPEPAPPSDGNTFLPPSSVSATAVSSSKINLTWKDKSSGELDFRIERRTASGGWAEVGTSGANTTAYTDGSMSLNTTYYYRIRARNQSGYTAYSSEASAKTLAPTTLQFATQPGNGEAGKPLSQQPVVNVLDQNGNLVKNYNGQIQLSLATNPSGAAVSNNTVTAADGVAKFTAVQLDKGGNGYTFSANAASGSPAITNGAATSNGFDISGSTAPVAPPIDRGKDQRNAPIGLTQFQQLWERADKAITDGQTSRSWLWGPSITGLLTEPYAEGGTRQVQYFDKTRMEQTKGRPVTNGLLTKELITGLMQLGDNTFRQYPANDKIKIAGDQDAAQNPTYASFRGVSTIDKENQAKANSNVVSATINKDGVVGADAALGTKYNVKNTYFDPTLQHNIPNVFWDFMHQTGPVYVNGAYSQGLLMDWVPTMGLPLSEAYWTRSVVAGVEQDVLVQVFERRVLTFTPANNQAFQVEMGNVGQHYREWSKAVESTPAVATVAR